MPSTYEFRLDECQLQKDFPNFYYRVRNVQEIIVAYCRYGELYAIYPYNDPIEDAPRIYSVTFEEKDAKRYEKTVERECLRRKYKDIVGLPRPQFAVTLGIHVAFELRETYEFDFRNYTDEALIEFGEKLKKRYRIALCQHLRSTW